MNSALQAAAAPPTDICLPLPVIQETYPNNPAPIFSDFRVPSSMQDEIGRHMSPTPVMVHPDTLCADALRILNENAISVLFVVEDDEKLVGIVHMHDIVRTGVA